MEIYLLYYVIRSFKIGTALYSQSRRASQQNVVDEPGLATDSVVLCNLRHINTACVNSGGSKFMLSSINNTVSDLHSQGVPQSTRERERPESRAESSHPQGVALTSLQREFTVTCGESTSTGCDTDIPGTGEFIVTRGE
jgi:hypothetical protein